MLSREQLEKRLGELKAPYTFYDQQERQALETAQQLGEWLGMANRFPGLCSDCPADGKSCHPNSKRLPCESVRNRIRAWLQESAAI